MTKTESTNRELLEQIDVVDLVLDGIGGSPISVDQPCPATHFDPDETFRQVGVDADGEPEYSLNLAQQVMFCETLELTIRSRATAPIGLGVTIIGTRFDDGSHGSIGAMLPRIAPGTTEILKIELSSGIRGVMTFHPHRLLSVVPDTDPPKDPP